jgi:hypothetical protein
MEPSSKDPAASAFTELLELLLKLNSKIRGKISPRRKEEKSAPDNVEMVIIILNQSSESAPRPPRAEKSRAPKKDWIDDLCQDIEGSGGSRKTS